MNYPRIILILLCIAAAILYARVLLPPEDKDTGSGETVTPAEEPGKQPLKPLPPGQMELVIRTLAPEMAQTRQ